MVSNQKVSTDKHAGTSERCQMISQKKNIAQKIYKEMQSRLVKDKQ